MNGKSRKAKALNKQQIDFIKGCSTLQKGVWRITYSDPLKSLRKKLNSNVLKEVILLSIIIRRRNIKALLKSALQKWLNKAKLISNLKEQRRVFLKHLVAKKDTNKKILLSRYIQKWKNITSFSEQDILDKYGYFFKVLEYVKKHKLKPIRQDFLKRLKKYVNRENKQSIKNLFNYYSKGENNNIKRAIHDWQKGVKQVFIDEIKRKLLKVVIYSLKKRINREKLIKALKNWDENVKKENALKDKMSTSLLSIYSKWIKFKNNSLLIAKFLKWRAIVNKKVKRDKLLKQLVNKLKDQNKQNFKKTITTWKNNTKKISDKEKQKEIRLRLISLMNGIKQENQDKFLKLKYLNIWKSNIEDLRYLDENIPEIFKTLKKIYTKPAFDNIKKLWEKKRRMEKFNIFLKKNERRNNEKLLHWWFSTWRKNVRYLGKLENYEKITDITNEILLVNIIKKKDKVTKVVNRGLLGKYLYKWRSKINTNKNQKKDLIRPYREGSEILQRFVFRTTHHDILDSFDEKLFNFSIMRTLPKLIQRSDKKNRKNILKHYILQWKLKADNKPKKEKLRQLFEKYYQTEIIKRKLMLPFSNIANIIKNCHLGRKQNIDTIVNYVSGIEDIINQMKKMKQRLALFNIFNIQLKNTRLLKLTAAFKTWKRKDRTIKADEQSKIIQHFLLKKLKNRTKNKSLNILLIKLINKKEKDNMKKLRYTFNKWYNLIPILRREEAANLIIAFLRGNNFRKKFGNKKRLNEILLRIINKQIDKNYIEPSFYKWCKNTRKLRQIENAIIIQKYLRNLDNKKLKNKSQLDLGKLFKRYIFKVIANALKLKYLLEKIISAKTNKIDSYILSKLHKWRKNTKLDEMIENSIIIQNFSRKLKNKMEREKMNKNRKRIQEGLSKLANLRLNLRWAWDKLMDESRRSKAKDLVKILKDLINKRRNDALNKIKDYINKVILYKLLPLRKKYIDNILRKKLNQWRNNAKAMNSNFNNLLRKILLNFLIKYRLKDKDKLRQILRLWIDKAKKINEFMAGNRIAKYFADRYKISNSRQNWKNLSNKLKNNKYNKEKGDLINKLKKLILLRNMIKDLDNKIKTDGIKQVKDGDSWNKKTKALYGLLKIKIKNNMRNKVRKWDNVAKKICEREKLMDEALRNVAKRQMLIDLNTLANCLTTIKVVRAVPLAGIKRFIKQLDLAFRKKLRNNIDKLKKLLKIYEKKNNDILKKYFDKWYKIANNKEPIKERIARWIERQYKVSNARKKWNDLVNKYNIFINKKILFKIRKNILKNLRIKAMLKILKNRFLNSANDQFNNGINFKKIIKLIKLILTNLDKRKRLMTLHNYINKWNNKAKKLKKRENDIKKSFDIINNKSTILAANLIKDASVVKNVTYSVPVAKSYNFLERMRNLAERMKNFDNLKRNLVLVKDEVVTETKFKLLKNIYRIYYYKHIKNLFDRIRNLQDRYRINHEKYFMKKLKYLSLLNNKKYITKEKSYEYSPQIKTIKFKNKKEITKNINHNHSVISLILPSFIKYIDNKIKNQKEYALKKLKNNYKGSKFSELYKKWNEKQILVPKEELINILKNNYLYLKDLGLAKRRLAQLFKRYCFKLIKDSLKKSGRMFKIIYLTKLTLMHQAIASKRFVKEIIRKWQFKTFTHNLARYKMEMLYKNLQSSYLEMMNGVLGGREFEGFANKMGLFTNEDYKYPPDEEYFCQSVHKKYVFQPMHIILGKEKVSQIFTSELDSEESKTNSIAIDLDNPASGDRVSEDSTTKNYNKFIKKIIGKYKKN